MQSARPFSREEFESAPRTLMRQGHAANACVYHFCWQGLEWTVKDFASKGWLVRHLLGPLVLWRERKNLSRLAGVEGVPQRVFRIDAMALAIEYVPGDKISHLVRDSGDIPVALLEQMEALMNRVHAAGMLHLDARGMGNWIVRPEGTPALIDFQTALGTRWMPARLRSLLEDLDMSGVLRKWEQFHPEAMGVERKKRLERGSRLRHLWPVKGYLGLRK